MVLTQGNMAPFILQMKGQDLRVVEFSLKERISSPFELKLTIASDHEIDIDEVVGNEALFKIIDREADRNVHGIVNQFDQAGTIESTSMTRFFLYRAAVVPTLWVLSLEQDCRIFQENTVPEIVKIVLKEGGIPEERIEFRLRGTYEPREYCVQYRETDLNFISRLLEEEGIFYSFEHRNDSHTMIFGDSTINYEPIRGNPKLVFNPPEDMATEEEYVFKFSLSRRLCTGKSTLRDFNFKRPALDLTCKDQVQCKFQPEIYDYPGEYADVDRGNRLAKVRLQETVIYKDTADGQSCCPRMTAGYKFTLGAHEIENFNREYLVVEAFHFGSQSQVLEERSGGNPVPTYENRFVAIPADVVFRSKRTTPQPIMEGVQTAIVVGPPGEEIYTDMHGRVKVQFHWDREGKYDEHSSCWIRVSQLWAGAGWGAMFIPRIGHEVIVDFVEGDPDRPIITGRVYNALNKPPYPLPDGKTKSTIKSESSFGGYGSNEFRFEDAEGDEEIYLHAQKDYSIAIENDKNQAVGHNETHSVKKNRSTSIGANESLSVGESRSKYIGGEENCTIKKDGTRTYLDGNEKITLQKGNRELTIELGGQTVKAPTGKYSLEAKDVKITASNSITIMCGGGSISMDASGKLSVKGLNLESFVKVIDDVKGRLAKFNT